MANLPALAAMTDRDLLTALLLRQEYGLDDAGLKLYRSRHLTGSPGRDYWGEAQETADVLMAAGFTRASVIAAPVLEEALGTAEGWSEHGYTETSKSYWTGVRDTLRVVLGRTTEVPTGSAEDASAFTILGAQQRHNQKAPR